MTVENRSTRNANIATSIVAVGLLAFFGQLAFIILAPDLYFEALHEVSAKVYLTAISALLCALLGVMLYVYFHEPSPMRYTLWVGRSISFLSASAVGFSIFGWPRLVSVNSDGVSQIDFDFLFDQPSGVSWELLFVVFFSLLSCAIVYGVLNHYEKISKRKSY